MKTQKLLSVGIDSKTVKGQKYGYLTGILYMTPHTTSTDKHNFCPKASKECIASCLNTSGRGIFTNVQKSRLNKRNFYINDRHGFMTQLRTEIHSLLKKSTKLNLTPCVRLNGTSDIQWENYNYPDTKKSLFEEFSNVQWYDYTKITNRSLKNLPTNYHLTYSYSGENQKECLELLKSKNNVSVVFKNSLPKKLWGYKVINADDSDLRFLDPKGVVCGLKYKRTKNKPDFSNSKFII